jgi:ribose/xylose/arabinose/galactoside ABC-type transport system permease subunit
LTLGLRATAGLPFGIVILVVLAVGLIAGLVNGLLVGWLKINPFIATLATSGLFIGAAVVYSSGNTIQGQSGKTPVPAWFSGVGSVSNYVYKAPAFVVWILALVAAASAAVILTERLGQVGKTAKLAAVACAIGLIVLVTVPLASTASWPVVLVIALTLLCWAALRYTTFGRNVTAVGSNMSAARLAGVPVTSTVILAYVVTALLGSVGGILTAGSLGSISADVTDSYLLPTYTTVFLSTVLFSEGRFHPWGTILGGYALVEVSQGLAVGGVTFTWSQLLNAVALLLAVTLGHVIRGRQQ